MEVFFLYIKISIIGSNKPPINVGKIEKYLQNGGVFQTGFPIIFISDLI